MIIYTQILVITAATNPKDLATLNALKSSWEKLPPNWKGADPCGRGWEGVTCNNNSRVIYLKLAGIGLIGTEFSDISSFSELVKLDLSNNKGLKGTLPSSIGNLNKLDTLILVGCSFFGPIPESIGSLKELIYLGLNNNSFIGPIPRSIGNLSKLSWLDLSDNNLNGSIPVSSETEPGLDWLLKARHFHLSKNQFSGTLQPQLFNSSMSLLHVVLDHNKLSGEIPSTLGLLPNLTALRLDRNLLTGPVPSNLSNLIKLNELHLSNNNLNGPFPNLTGMNSLNYVDMSNNSFDPSDVPSWISSLQNLTTLLMDNTQLQGQIPSSFFSLPQLESVVLRNNNLTGTLDIGSSYSSNLTVDLQNNSITDFKQRAGYNMNLTLEDNPICDGIGTTGRYCRNPPLFRPSANCFRLICGSDRFSQNCRVAYPTSKPYTGTINFFAFSFSDLENSIYYTSLAQSIMGAFSTNNLPVDSVSLCNPILDGTAYLQVKLQVFPSGQDYFNRTGVSEVGNVLNRQLFPLAAYFGPFSFIQEIYEYFPGENKSSNVGIIVGATVGGSVLLVLLICAGLYAFRQKKRAEKAVSQSNPFASWNPDKGSGGIPQLQGARWFAFDELRKCTNNFSEESIIGSGGYGKVYRGKLVTGQLVAIKRAQQGSLQGDHEFKTEIELLSRIHHKNVVSLVGFCYEQAEQMLIYEYISNGTLKESLSGKSGIRLDWVRRIKVALDSARGLSYMHELANPPIIHRDVKPTNILLDARLNAKVADFGISKLVSDIKKGYVSTQVKGTMGYMDPEYYMTQQLTEKSDVYSFGIVLLELLTARAAIQEGRHIVREVQDAMVNIQAILDPTLGSSSTLGGLDKFVTLAMKCVNELGADRPTMSEVVREIENIAQLANLNLNAETNSTSSSHEGGVDEDLYHPYGSQAFDHSTSSVPFETELRR